MKKNEGFVALDVTLSIIAIFIFSTLIFSLMYNNALENKKIKRETMATIYLTEVLENIGIAEYEDVTEENLEVFIPSGLAQQNYNMEIALETDLALSDTEDEDLVKKITASISYKLGNKEYKYSMERTKIKE